LDLHDLPREKIKIIPKNLFRYARLLPALFLDIIMSTLLKLKVEKDSAKLLKFAIVKYN